MKVLRHPYTLADTDELPAAYLAGVYGLAVTGQALEQISRRSFSESVRAAERSARSRQLVEELRQHAPRRLTAVEFLPAEAVDLVPGQP